jgi:hypothetical protein
MKRFARLDAGVVTEIVATDKDISRMFHPRLSWVDVTNLTVAIGDLDQGGTFAKPPAQTEPTMPTVAQLQAEIVRLTDRLAVLEKHCG